MITGSFIRIPR